ncbi:hypothetical protein EH243_09120 [Amphritea opalescens]|uniref:Uncharacterized protein n=1 Tax=Amphritea opalescens TaxID=2490544 RepID=A0A430KQP8_9GAMM|nr:hypothetical protein [Amphritea opalescens]RTE65841.1 hypothetical protein EH243_09120 [Amphritea opalescens]
MGSTQWIILAFIIMAGLGYWNYQRMDGQRKALQTAGFQISDELKGNPPLLISASQRQIAVLNPSGYQRFSFDQLQGAEVRSDSLATTDTRFRVALILDGEADVEIGFENEPRADIALKQLRRLTGH